MKEFRMVMGEVLQSGSKRKGLGNGAWWGTIGADRHTRVKGAESGKNRKGGAVVGPVDGAEPKNIRALVIGEDWEGHDDQYDTDDESAQRILDVLEVRVALGVHAGLLQRPPGLAGVVGLVELINGRGEGGRGGGEGQFRGKELSSGRSLQEASTHKAGKKSLQKEPAEIYTSHSFHFEKESRGEGHGYTGASKRRGGKCRKVVVGVAALTWDSRGANTLPVLAVAARA